MSKDGRVLNLIREKGKDLRYLKSMETGQSLNAYKILTKALAMRLQKGLPKLINSDQVRNLKNREKILIIFDLLNYTDINQIEAYLVQIDFEKAFDSIE